MKTKLLAISILLLLLSLTGCGQAQTIITTWQQQVFTNQTTNATSAIVRNVNQASHVVTYCSTSLVSTLNIVIQGSGDGVSGHWVNISNVGTTVNGCNIIQGGGYYPYVQVVLSNVTNSGGTINAWYSASTGVTATPANAGMQLTSNPVTLLPALGATNTALKSTAYSFQTAPVVLYVATFSNPNAGLVYCGVSENTTVFGTNPTYTLIVGVPAGGTVSLHIPSEGLSLTPNASGGLYAACSTSPTTATDPATGIVAALAWKLSNNGVVN